MTEDLSKRKYVTDADVILMLPGRRDPKEDMEILLTDADDSAEAQCFIDIMNKVLDIELGDGASAKTTRYNLGKVRLHFAHDEDMPRQDDLAYEAFLILALHNKTKLSVFELYISNCDDTVQALECYRNGAMTIAFPEAPEEFITEDALYERYQVDRYGSKRSVVFAYGEPSVQERAHCLANELTPVDGDIRGELLYRASECNRSQYSGVSTYASPATLLECVHTGADGSVRGQTPEDKYFYQSSEIYFVEILQFQDASAANIQMRLKEIQAKSKKDSRSVKEYELTRITTAIAHAAELFDVHQIPWPTVRFSVALLSEDFGLSGIEERCQRNNDILQGLIEKLKEQEQKDDDKIKNHFLFIITALSTISTIYGALGDFQKKDVYYLIAIGLAAAAYIAYLIWKKQKPRLLKKRAEKKFLKEKEQAAEEAARRRAAKQL